MVYGWGERGMPRPGGNQSSILGVGPAGCKKLGVDLHRTQGFGSSKIAAASPGMGTACRSQRFGGSRTADTAVARAVRWARNRERHCVGSGP
jgi:hypothetical protein